MSGNGKPGRRQGRRRRAEQDGTPVVTDELVQGAQNVDDSGMKDELHDQTEPIRPDPRDPELLDGEYGDSSTFMRFSALLGVLALVLLAAALVLYNVVGRVNANVGGLLVIAAILGVLYAIPRFGEITASLRSRSARQGSSATLVSVAFIGLLVTGNWLANRHGPQWDLTASRRYTLSDQTTRIINQLDRDVHITAFFPSRQEDTFIRGTKDLLRQYDRRSDRITVEFIDPDINPGAARQFEIQTYPVTIFQAGDRREETSGVTEQDFTSSLLKLTRTEQKKVYFLQGNQERDPASAQQGGYHQAAEALRRENYVVETLSLLATPRVPDDADVLVIAGPRAPLLDPVLQAIEEYVGRGGTLFYLAEPRQEIGIEPLLAEWQVLIGNDLVVDPGRSYPNDPLTPAPLPQPGHRISASLPDLLLPGTRTVSMRPGAGSGWAISPLLRTTDRSWAETNFNTPAAPTPGEDQIGPLTVAIAVHRVDPTSAVMPGMPAPPAQGSNVPKGRIVVVGNAEFASNTYFTQVLGNRDFFINAVNWLAEEEDLISIRAEPQGHAPIVLTNQSQVLVLYSTVIFMPLSVLLIGAVIWWQRR